MVWVVDLIPYIKNITIHNDIHHSFSKYVKAYYNEIYKKASLLNKDGKSKEAKILLDDESAVKYFNVIENKYFPRDWDLENKRRAASNVLIKLKEEEAYKSGVKNGAFYQKYTNNLKKISDYNPKQVYILLVWKYKQKRWSYSKKPLFFDVGDDFVYRSFENLKFGNGFIVKKYSKELFLTKYKNM